MTVKKLTDYMEENSNVLMAIGLLTSLVILLGLFYYQKIGPFSETIEIRSDVDYQISVTKNYGILHGIYQTIKNAVNAVITFFENCIFQIYMLVEGMGTAAESIACAILGFLSFSLILFAIVTIGSLLGIGLYQLACKLEAYVMNKGLPGLEIIAQLTIWYLRAIGYIIWWMLDPWASTYRKQIIDSAKAAAAPAAPAAPAASASAPSALRTTQ